MIRNTLYGLPSLSWREAAAYRSFHCFSDLFIRQAGDIVLPYANGFAVNELQLSEQALHDGMLVADISPACFLPRHTSR